MKKYISLFLLAVVLVVSSAFKEPVPTRLVTKSGYISFSSDTKLLDFKADNYKVVSVLNTTTGKLVYSVTMQCFEFKTPLMQKKFNSPKFLDTKEFPKAKFVGVIDNMGAVDFRTQGDYEVNVRGEMNIHGVSKSIIEKATIRVDDNKVTVKTNMNLELADYGINFKDGKPAKNIAKVVTITSIAEYVFTN